MENLSSKKIIKSISAYSFLGILPAASRIVLLPIYLTFLTPSDFAIIGLNLTILNAVTILMSLGLEMAFAKFYFNYCINKKILHSYYSTIFISIFIISIVSIFLISLVGQKIQSAVFNEPSFTFYPFGITALIFAMVSSLNALILALYRNQHNTINYMLLAGGSFLTLTISEFYGIVILHSDVAEIIILKTICITVFSFIVWIIEFWNKGLSFELRFLKPSLIYSLPFIPYLVFFFINTNYDRILVANYLSLNALAIFNCSIAVVTLIEIIMNAISGSITPELFKYYKNGYNANLEKINKLYRTFGLAIIAVICTLCFITPIAFYNFLTTSYFQAVILIPLLLLGALIRFIHTVSLNIIYFYDQTKKLPWLNFVSCIITITFNLLLLPLIGIYGAVITYILSRIIQLALCYRWASKTVPISFSFGLQYFQNILIYICASLLILPLICAYNPYHNLHYIIYSLPLIILIASLYFNVLKNISYTSFRSVLKQYLAKL